MENPVQEEKPISQSTNTKKPSFKKCNKWKAAFFILLSTTTISCLSYKFLTQNRSEGQKTEIGGSSTPEDLLVVNSHSSIQDERRSYFTFQIKYPSEYLVTSDEMVTSYDSQGGMAPPRLIFTKGNQAMSSSESTYRDVWKSGEDCILIWFTSGWDTIEDFQTHGGAGNPPETISQKQLTILEDNYLADKRVVKYPEKQTNNVEVFVQLPETVAYFFQTCNMNSEKDLEVVLSNFKVRADGTHDATEETFENVTDAKIGEVEDVRELVNNFETAIKEKNIADIMNYFTPPQNAEEEELYNSIMTGPAGPRLFNNVASRFDVQSWKIARREYPDNNELISKEDGRYFVVVEETRRGWDPVKGDYSPWSTGFYVIEIVKFNDRLLIDKYYWQQASPREEASSLKYRGLGF